ncbi:MAG: hypothetical protein FJW79_05825 [Actinobacteria bacterium]|nr:hypothetical protein [Actinomycetota bacterium]
MARASPWDEVLISHARRYPGWEAVDLCKLAHQATLGSEHAAPREPAAREWLERELQEMGPGPVEPLVDPIRPDGALVRVHLRPGQAAGLDPGVLLDAFLGTARGWVGSVSDLEVVLEWAAEHAGAFGLDGAAVTDLAVRMREAGYPAVHHSAAYSRRYRPAYRVVAARLLPEAWRPLTGR